ARAMQAQLDGLRSKDDVVQRRLEAKRMQDPRAIRADLNPGADLRELRSALEHPNLEAGLMQRQGGGEATYAGPGDQHRHAQLASTTGGVVSLIRAVTSSSLR